MEKIKTQTIRNSGRISFALTRNHQVVKIAFVIIMISFVWMSVAAQYPYIRIADVLVSPENQDNITSDYITGIVRYDSVSRTLILKNASINNYESGDPYDDSNGNTVIIEAHSGQTVNIELIGDNTIFGKIPLELHSGSYNITGAGSLTLNGTVAGVLCEMGVDTFHIGPGASVEIIVSYVLSTGFTGSPQYQDYSQTLLSIDSGTLIIEAGYCIRSVVDFQLNGSFIASPEGAYYDPGDKTLVTEEGPVHDYLEIRPGTVGINEYSNIQFRAWGCEGGIKIEDVPENSSLEIINMLGQTVCQTKLNSTEAFIPTQCAVYIVRVNKSSVKVVVK